MYKITHASPPLFPIVAIQQKQEGWALTQYNVNPDGSVTNVKVVDASPKDIFDIVAIKAASTFRYAPVVKNPQTQIHCNLFHFKLEK
jgi:protein TonB